MTKEEFIQDFKERIVDGVYDNLPKDYRKSKEYTELDFDDRFNESFKCYYFKYVLFDVIEKYYDKIHEYEEMLGY